MKKIIVEKRKALRRRSPYIYYDKAEMHHTGYEVKFLDEKYPIWWGEYEKNNKIYYFN